MMSVIFVLFLISEHGATLTYVPAYLLTYICLPVYLMFQQITILMTVCFLLTWLPCASVYDVGLPICLQLANLPLDLHLSFYMTSHQITILMTVCFLLAWLPFASVYDVGLPICLQLANLPLDLHLSFYMTSHQITILMTVCFLLA